MPFPSDTSYPANATNAAWQKKKSFLDKAKAGSKTGVGAKLTAAQTAWAAIPFDDLDDSKNKPTTSTAALASLNKAKAAHIKVASARTALKAAIAAVTTQSTSKDLSGTSKTALKAILADLKAADKRLELMDDLVTLFQVDHNNIVKEESDKVAAAKAKTLAARATLTHVEIKSGSTLLATAPTAKRQADNSYWATTVAWKSPMRDLDYLQKKLTLKGKATDGSDFSEDMTLSGIVGDGTFKFKYPPGTRPTFVVRPRGAAWPDRAQRRG